MHGNVRMYEYLAAVEHAMDQGFRSSCSEYPYGRRVRCVGVLGNTADQNQIRLETWVFMLNSECSNTDGTAPFPVCYSSTVHYSITVQVEQVRWCSRKKLARSERVSEVIGS